MKKVLLTLVYVFLVALPLVHADSEDVTVSATVLPADGNGSGGGGGVVPIENVVPPTSITFSGQAFFGAHLVVLKDGTDFLSTIALANGSFSMNYSGLVPGTYVFTIFVESPTGIRFLIGTYTVVLNKGMSITISGITIPQDVWDKIFNIDTPIVKPKPGETDCIATRADINCDGRVNIVDLSILLYWYKSQKYSSKVDLNTDKIIDLGDFSVLAYAWTG